MRKIFAIFSALLVTLFSVSCDKISTNISQRDKPGDENPRTPGTPEETGETISMDAIAVDYYGEFYAAGVHNFVISLSSGTYDDSGDYFVDKGVEVVMDINLSQASLRGCTLKCSEDETASNCFLAGYVDEDEATCPTYVYVQRSITDDSLDCDLDYVTSGTVSLTPNGVNISVYADLTTSGGKNYKVSYSGPFTVTDQSGGEGGEGGEGDYEDITVAAYKNLPAGDKTWYYMTGVISDTYHPEWGNFYLSDDTGKINIYGLLDTDGTQKTAYTKYGLCDGATVTILVNKAMWSSSHNDIVDAYYVDSSTSGGAGDGPEGDYEMKGISEVYAYNLGADYDVSTTDYDDWEIYMYNGNEDEFLCVSVLTAGGSGENLAPGTYTVKALESESDFHAGICVAAYNDEDGYVYGTYYGYGEYAWYWAETGTVTISKSGDDYTINVAFTDSVEEADFKCSYTGPVTCYDMSSVDEASTKSASGFCRKGARSHRSVFRHATVKAPVTCRSAASVRHSSSGRTFSLSSSSVRVAGRACVRGASCRHNGKTVR